jgi:hypothetical protein
MNKVEFSADTGAPRIIIQSNPSWEQWVEICEAVWVTALEGGCNYWMDDLKYDHDRPWVPWKHSQMKSNMVREWRKDIPDLDIKNGNHCIRNFPIKVYHNADDWESGESEVTEGMSFEVITVGINNLPPYTKMSIIDPWTRDIDAEIADQIVQTGLFGSAVYG